MIADLGVGPRSVVAGEDDQRILIEAEALEFGEHLAHGCVEFLHRVAV